MQGWPQWHTRFDFFVTLFHSHFILEQKGIPSSLTMESIHSVLSLFFRGIIDCKSNKKSCLKRINIDVFGTVSKPQKSRNSCEYLRKTIRRDVVGIEKISSNNRALSIG